MEKSDVVDELTIEQVNYEWNAGLEADNATESVQPHDDMPAPSLPAEGPSKNMLPEEEISELKSRWQMLQLKFVDEPWQSVELADELISNLIRRLDQVHTERGKSLDDRRSESDFSTEDYRVLLQDYRACFENLVEV